MSASPLSGAPPDRLEEFAAQLEEFRADNAKLHAEIAELRKNSATSEADLDGQPRPAGTWKMVKEITEQTGYSDSGIRKLCKQGKITPWRSGGRLWANLNTMPRKRKCESAT